MASQDDRQTIMIVDDNPTNLGVIVDYLEDHDFRIIVARDGETAVKRAQFVKPDIILLDVMMPPGIDGFETCRRLKSNSLTQEIPVIFMTALARVEDKVTGFEVGAVDYVTKPIQQEEVLARVTTHLTIQKQKKQLEAMTAELQVANERLVDLNASKDKFFTIIAHDLRNSFNGLIGNAQLLLLEAQNESPDEILKIADDIYKSGSEAYNLLQNLLHWAMLQQGQMVYQPSVFSLKDITERTIALLQEPAAQKNISLMNNLTTDWSVLADQNMIRVILRNLVSNSIKFTPEGGRVAVHARPDSTDNGNGEQVCIYVTDTGVGMSPDVVKRVYRQGEYYSSPGTKQESGSGLGLMLCREMIARHGGRIEIQSGLDQGTTIGFTLATAADNNKS